MWHIFVGEFFADWAEFLMNDSSRNGLLGDRKHYRFVIEIKIGKIINYQNCLTVLLVLYFVGYILYLKR
jgi:hypothetical protein